MKKRFIAIMASCLVLGILFTGCGKGKNDVKDEVTKVESEAGKLLDEGKSAIEGFVSKIQADVKTIEEAVKMEGKATLEIVKEGEETLKYKFTVAEEAVGTEISEFEEKAAGLEE